MDCKPPTWQLIIRQRICVHSLSFMICNRKSKMEQHPVNTKQVGILKPHIYWNSAKATREYLSALSFVPYVATLVEL